MSAKCSSVYLGAVHCANTVLGPSDKTRWDAHSPCSLAGEGRDADGAKGKVRWGRGSESRELHPGMGGGEMEDSFGKGGSCARPGSMCTKTAAQRR